MVWLIAGLPALAVVAGISTVFIAAHDPDSLVNDQPDKQGMTVVEARTPADLRAGELGIAAELRVDGNGLKLHLRGALAPMPAQVRLTIIHPTRTELDQTLVLNGMDGMYAAALPEGLSGRREYVLENEDKAWRIAGEGVVSAGGIPLVAKSSHSSTHP